MRKFISTVFVISMFAATSFADGPITPPNPNCTRGHINTPVFVCEPQPQSREGSGAGGLQAISGDESVMSVIETFIAGLNPFGYFLH